jgi:hypothetical protein
VADAPRRFDPLGLLTTLDRNRVAYIVVGAFGRVVHGAEEVTRDLDIVPSTKPDNLERLEAALEELRAEGRGRRTVSAANIDPGDGDVIELSTNQGELKIVWQPEGTGGYDDLRRAATREPLGKGVRPAVASVDDLARMLAALGREEDQAKLRDLRRLAELELNRGIEL